MHFLTNTDNAYRKFWTPKLNSRANCIFTSRLLFTLNQCKSHAELPNFKMKEKIQKPINLVNSFEAYSNNPASLDMVSADLDCSQYNQIILQRRQNENQDTSNYRYLWTISTIGTFWLISTIGTFWLNAIFQMCWFFWNCGFNRSYFPERFIRLRKIQVNQITNHKKNNRLCRLRL